MIPYIIQFNQLFILKFIIIIMKKEHSEGLTLEFLEKKYQQQKQILLKENKRLKANLEAEIQRGDLEKAKREELQRENQTLNAIIVELRAEAEEIQDSQSAKQAHCELMTQYQDTIRKYKTVLTEKGELETLIEQIYNEKISLQKELQQYRANQRELQSQMEELADKHSQFKAQSTKQIEQMISINKGLEEEVERANAKSNDQRKKTKELQKKMMELERRLQMSEELEEKKFTEQLVQLRTQRDKLYQKNLEFNTKCSLFESKISQLEKHQQHLEEQLRSSEKKVQTESDKNYEMRSKLQKQQKLIAELEDQVEKLKQQYKELENQKNTVPKQDLMKQMRKNLTDINELSHKNLQRIGQGPTLRDYPSQSQFGVFIKQDDGLEKAKLQGQINALQSEILTYKKQIQTFTDQLRRLKRTNDDKQHEIQRKQIQIRQMKSKLQKQIERGRQILALRKQNQSLRGKQTQMIERAKQVAEYETSISLKLAFYQRKIKENLDSIDRKESIIEKHKTTLSQMEERQKYYEQALKKLNDEVESLRGYKQQCNRKDILLKQYKAKNEKLKEEKDDSTKDLAKIKADITKIRNDKQRFQTQLQIREKELSSLKLKYEKMTSDKTEQYYKENTRLKENKNVNDHKVKQLKKEKEELSQALQQIRSIIISKVQEFVAKQIPVGRKKGHQYEAAKLLGLKAGDLEDFLNPGANMSRRITVDLQDLWMEGNFAEFTNNFVNYLTAQLQQKNSQT